MSHMQVLKAPPTEEGSRDVVAQSTRSGGGATQGTHVARRRTPVHIGCALSSKRPPYTGFTQVVWISEQGILPTQGSKQSPPVNLNSDDLPGQIRRETLPLATAERSLCTASRVYHMIPQYATPTLILTRKRA
eukprot:2568920-Pyramimonas_sp.AAC.1